MSKPHSHHFFPAGEDLPLFTGQPDTAVVRPSQHHAHDAWTQIEMTLYRTTQPELFYPLRDALNNLSGPVVELPADTLVRLVQKSAQYPTKVLVATESATGDLYAWTWADRLEQI